MRWLLVAGLAGCSFHANEQNGIDAPAQFGSDAAPSDGTGDAQGSDSGSGSDFVPLHVPPGGRAPGTADLSLSVQTTINTSDPSIAGVQLPPGVTFDTWMQPGGPELAVLHVRAFSVSAHVTVVGSRALVVVASGTIMITGVLDASANLATPGAAGSPPQMGTGKGGVGGLQRRRPELRRPRLAAVRGRVDARVADGRLAERVRAREQRLAVLRVDRDRDLGLEVGRGGHVHLGTRGRSRARDGRRGQRREGERERPHASHLT